MVTISNDKPSIKDLLSRPEAEITTVLGGIYEHSVWVAEELVKNDCKRLDTVTALAASMKAIVDGSSNERKLELLCAHPDLCEKVGIFNELTKASQEEQSRAGLQSLTDEELERFTICNTEYRSKFGFPFILAVRNASKFTVLSALEGRVSNSVETEFVQAIVQVHKIAWMRLLTIINTGDAKGFLTCHVLDTANGCPGKGNAAVSPTCQYNDSVFFYSLRRLYIQLQKCEFTSTAYLHQNRPCSLVPLSPMTMVVWLTDLR
jgi:2-oxo-4-hydroxy-4-carboxy-5-ureidoimidazoline decarboxylase